MIRFGILALVSLLVTGCVASREGRTDLANTIAASNNLAPHVIDAGLFNIASFERVRQRSQPINLYIEGDGYIVVARGRISYDPTPTDPVALRLAAADDAANVAYLARPCQYVTNAACQPAYWLGKREAPEVIDAMSAALDALKLKYGITGFHLIGFSGGGAVATLLAAKRHDILDLRTVAGGLDQEAFASLHNLTPMWGSLDPADVAAHITHIPQRHFVGRDDTNIPIDIARSYAAKSGRPDCIAITDVEGASHTDGWAERWPALLKLPLKACE